MGGGVLGAGPFTCRRGSLGRLLARPGRSRSGRPANRYRRRPLRRSGALGLGDVAVSRPSWVEIDLGAVAHNVRQLAAHASDAKLCAVVKADGYGHGAPAVAKTALDNGAAWLAVATVEEGVQLREEGITAPVLLLSEPPRDDLDAVANADLTPTLYTVPAVDALAQVVHRRGEGGMEVHLKVDTGMHRVGAHPKALPELARRVSGRPPLRLGGIWSHFAVADTDPDFTRRQIEIFDRAVRLAKAALPAGSPPVLRHLANTPGALFHPDSHLDMVRTGLGIYGLYPHPAARPLIDLRPAMKIVSHVSHVLRHPQGARPSYGRVRPLPASSKVATLPLGYADGIPRGISEGGEVLIGGRRFPLAGRVTMDQMVVDVGDQAVEVGDEAVLVGAVGSESISLDDWAELSDTINYEVVSRIGPRLPRRHVS
ncbi:MAG: alanine racemase [Acidimicrobiia bacterium]|nr:alanine racemase [Acidimicrobiia bacterium]MYK56735.1 alanine racemase [Acidimicrobiia bacterium]